MMAENPFREVTLRVPAGMYGGDPRGMINHVGMYGTPLGGDRWAVRPNDDKRLVTSCDLADETGIPHHFERLNQVPVATDTAIDEAFAAALYARLIEQLEPRLKAEDVAALFHLIQANIITAHGDRKRLIAAVQDGYKGIGNMPSAVTGGVAFPDRSAHLVMATDLLIRRVRLPGIMFRFDQDPDAMSHLTNIKDDAAAGRMFGSSTDWYQQVIGLVHYLGPLLGCMSPRFWCLPAPVPPFAILYSLGMDLAGTRESPMELLQLIPTPNRDEPTGPVALSEVAGRQAIHWWAIQLNRMFQYLSDPTTFRDSDGNYAAHAHHHWMLTFGQTFGLTTSLQLAVRDRTAQRAAMNSLLDAFADRILGRSFDRLCTWSFAKKTADRVRTKMSPAAAAILMPAADRAVDALQQAQTGFFIQRQRGEDDVVLKLPDGGEERRSPERAIAMLLKLYRDATHGFGPRPGNRRKNEIDAALLVQHEGEMPADVAYLPYLYLLDTLSQPDRAREHIARKVARSE